jgi:hypothetical protein
MLASPLPRRKISGLAAAFALATMTGTAFAAGLPQAASQTASDTLAKLGISVPGPDSHAGTHPAGQADHATGNSVSELATTTTLAGRDKGKAISAAARATHSAKTSETGHGKGSTVSTVATTTTSTGVDKGAEISTTASGGTSQAGQHGGVDSHTTSSSSGGTGTADQASNGASQHGTSTANTASNGHSSGGGSGNSGH